MKPTAASSVIDRKGELLQTHGNDGRAINLGSDQGHNFWEIAQTFRKLGDRNKQQRRIFCADFRTLEARLNEIRTLHTDSRAASET
jgi:hypothetical protein